MTDKQRFHEILQRGKRMVFFGGAGVSTECGIPDFRGTDGLYHQQYDYPPEVMLSHSFYVSHPEEFFRFYREKMLYLEARPGVTHKKVAELEQQGKLQAVVTQNIDGLHQMAGSTNVLELHGSVHRNYCTRCGRCFPAEFIRDSEGVPVCTSCGGTVKPDVVLYEEGLDSRTLDRAVQAIRTADVLIVAGTSLSVYPAASLTGYFAGDALVVLNKTPTPLDRQADLVLSIPMAEAWE